VIDLAAIAERRAAEQIGIRGRDLMWDPVWRAAPKPRQNTGRGTRPLSCECGECKRCRNRERMREYRAAHHAPGLPIGPSMSLGRHCQCGAPISNKNASGKCQQCWKKRAYRKRQALPRATSAEIARARRRLAANGITVEAA
jgi:hypothetical protein